MPQNIVSQWIRYMETSHRERRLHKNAELNYQESRANTPVLKSYPTRCYLEITDQCNLRCPMCGQNWFTYQRTFIPEEVLEKFKGLFPYLKDIAVFGFGESLVDKRFFDILAMIPRHINTRYVTNGLLMDRNACEKMIDLELNEISISMDAATSDTYYFVRRSKGFDKIVENIKTLVELKQQKNSRNPEIIMSYALFKRNAEEFLDFILLAHTLGVTKVSANYLIVYREDLMDESLYYHQELGNRVFREAKALAKQLGIDLFMPKSFEEAEPEESTGKLVTCYEPWEFVYFRSDGMIQPCCVNDTELGDITKQSFDEIWNGPVYQKFRKMVNTTRTNPNCAQCMGWGMRKVTDIEAHIKLLDKDGNVIGPNPDAKPGSTPVK